MSKFHINKHGVAVPCKAKVGNCPLGGQTGSANHFDTLEEAEVAANSQNENEYGILPQINNDPNGELLKEYNKIKGMIEGKRSSKANDVLRNILASMAKDIKGGEKEEISLKNLFANIKTPDGGATVSLKDYKVTSPTVGFCASPYPQYSKVFDDAKDINYDVLMDYIDEVNNDSGLFDKEETYLGLWNDPKTGKVYLDVSERYETADEARIACENNDQIAYFDLQLFESVDVDRKATSGQKGKGHTN